MGSELILNAANNQTFSIHQKNYSSIYGIFAFLKDLNGVYGSRYEIESYPRSGFNGYFLDKHFAATETYEGYWSLEGSSEISVTFDSFFILKGYALANSVRSVINPNSYPVSWEVYGVDSLSGTKKLLDSQENQEFCPGSTCSEEKVIGYQVKNPTKSFKKFVFKQTLNSYHIDYLYIHSFDFFGTLCTSNTNCYYPRITCRMKMTLNLFRIPITLLLYQE